MNCTCHETCCRMCSPAEATELDRAFAAKSKRDHVRALIVAELKAIGVLSADLRALLRADTIATAELAEALSPDSLKVAA